MNFIFWTFLIVIFALEGLMVYLSVKMLKCDLDIRRYKRQRFEMESAERTGELVSKEAKTLKREIKKERKDPDAEVYSKDDVIVRRLRRSEVGDE